MCYKCLCANGLVPKVKLINDCVNSDTVLGMSYLYFLSIPPGIELDIFIIEVGSLTFTPLCL